MRQLEVRTNGGHVEHEVRHQEHPATGSLRFGVLGPVQVTCGGSDLTPSRSRLRGLLALLLVRANTPVGSGVLIHELYGDRPPATATTALQVHVSHLRKTVFGECSRLSASQRLRTVRGGYLLRVEADELDLFRFESLAAEADRAMAGGNPARAAATFQTALALWRGPALADAVAPVLVEVFAPWAEGRRLDVLQRRIAAELEARPSAALIPELRNIVDEHPYVEGLRAQLILALYRSGRRAEALAEFADLAALLRTEMQCGPSAELQQLHQQMLVSDPALHGDRHVTVVEARPRIRPAQLPRDAAPLHGRDAEVEELLGALTSGQQRCVVGGCPGSGTSAVTLAVAHQVRHRFPDGQMFARIDAGTTPCDVLAGFLGALGHGSAALPMTLPERARALTAALMSRRVLIVLDDVPAGWGTAALAALRRLPQGSAVLANSAASLPELGPECRVRLGPLSEVAALEVLAARIGRYKVAREISAAKEIVQRCGRMPLAIRIIAARAAGRPHWTLRGIARRLAGPGLLDELVAGDVGVRESLLRRYRRCTDGQRSAFRSLAGLAAVRTAGPGVDIDVRPGVHIESIAAAAIVATGLLECAADGTGFVLPPLSAALATELHAAEPSAVDIATADAS